VHVRDEVLGYAAATQEDFGDFASAAVDGVEADGGRAMMYDLVEINRGAEVNIAKYRRSKMRA
jgi:hypothetical protein